jgi:hypothetical protein
MNQTATTQATYQIDVPFHFWDDHANRCDSQAVVVKKLAKKIRLDITGEEIADLLSDADVYADFYGDDRQANLGLVNSAKATGRNLRKQFTNDQIAAFSVDLGEREQARADAWEASPAGIEQRAEIAARREAVRIAKEDRVARHAAGDFQIGDYVKLGQYEYQCGTITDQKGPNQFMVKQSGWGVAERFSRSQLVALNR